MKLGDLLVKITKKLNIDTVFGVPGDYVMNGLDYYEKDQDITLCTTCNELNAGYAADAYARSKSYGMTIVTSGPGELSLVNAIAGSYAENIPVLLIAGCPKDTLIEAQLPVHHSLGDYTSPRFNRVFETVTCASSSITKHNYIQEIIRVISTMIKQKKPAYLNIPVNLFDMDVSEHIEDIHILGSFEQDFINLSIKKISSSNKPLLILGNDIKGKEEIIKSFIERNNIPFVSTLASKGVIGEDHPLFSGIFAGDFSDPITCKTVKNADCIISIGVLNSDMILGGFSISKYINEKEMIIFNRTNYQIEKRFFSTNINYDKCLEQLFLDLNGLDFEFSTFKNEYSFESNENVEFNGKLTQNKFWPFISCKHIIKENDIVIGEIGCSAFGLMTEKLPKNVSFVSQPKWSSIGYTLPASLGASMANKNSRVMLFIGDGSFNLTAQELSTISEYNLNINIFVINNDGYTVERGIHGPNAKYNDIVKWNYTKFAESVGIKHTLRCENFSELSNIDDFLCKNGPKLVELSFDKFDEPKLLKMITTSLES
ncbi:alpha-keto acid decarboxylase family protein [Francisella sp. SYW-9]|uniref:alpha-keto acid decarboxylase family protein n=1 Tax=Francisella sp. SYW-9 TaxID=2610888 RepID=UPI00123CFD42|nr:thiamine pyrophosphate-binding protein [Francisella sp. SYW-9]